MPSSAKSKSKKGKSASSSSLEKYQGMTLDELSQLDVDDDNDEEIDEDEAFNSDDEKNYGKYFSSTKTIFSDVGPRNIALSIPIIALTPTKDPNQQMRSVDIASGSTLTISSVCLDVMDYAFHRVRLMYRCVYDENDDDGEKEDDQFLALCNYLNTQRGGVGLMPSNAVNLKVVGPCRVDFRAGALPCVNLDDKINVFGVIEPLKYVYDYDEDDEDDDYFPYADAFMSGSSEEEDEDDDEDGEENMEDEEEEDEVMEGKIKASEKKPPVKEDNKASGGSTEGSSSSRKRKQDENVKDVVMDSTTNNAAESQSSISDNSKLTKAQRKKLAQEKAKQLEETLAAARNKDETKNSDSNNEPQTKKSKKQLKKEKAMEQNSTSTQTRERRLAGGLIVSDVVLGAGAPVKPGKRISLHYTGTLRSTGKVFDKNHSKQHPLVFRQGTGEVIRGKRLELVMVFYRSKTHSIRFARRFSSKLVFPLTSKSRVGTWTRRNESGWRESNYDSQ